MKWMFLPYRRYFDFSGRSRRLEYWLFTLLTILVSIAFVALILAGLPFARNLELDQNRVEFGIPFWLGLGGIVLFWLGSLIPGIAVTVRRFHDQDLSGWLYLLHFVPYIGGFIVLVMMCLGGTKGVNRFGADPKNPAADADVFA